MIRSVHKLFRRFATALAVVAALALVVDGALSADHHVAASAAGGHLHAQVGCPGQDLNDASGQQLVNGGVVDSVDIAAADRDSSPVSTPDTATASCSCASCAAIVLPYLSAEAAPFVLLRNLATTHRRHGDGVVLDGLRRPPRPLAIA